MAERIPAPFPMEVTLQDVTSVEPSSLDGDVFVLEETQHPRKLLESLNSLRLSNSFCDVVLCCGGRQFPCHRNVLASFSPYFQAMFTTEWRETQQMRVPISGVEPQIMDMLVTYGYTSKVAITAGNVQALLAASDLLNVAAVHEACWHYLERHMDENNCVGIHLLAEAHCRETLQKRSMDYILQHFSVVHRQEEFLSLSVDKLCEILSSDDVNVSVEQLVFEAAMLWIEKCPTRKQSAAKVLRHIRLAVIFLTSSYLQDVIECVDVVKESPACQRLISEAKSPDQLLLPSSLQEQPRWSTVGEMLVMVGERLTSYGMNQRNIITLDSFDPRTNQWRTLGRTPFNHCHSLRLVASGGSHLYGVQGDGGHMWRYERSHNSWSEMAPMPKMKRERERPRFGLVMLDGYLCAVPAYVYGGPDYNALPALKRYDHYSNSWQLVESVEKPIFHVFGDSAVVTLDGLIYFIGEDGGCSCLYKVNPQTLVMMGRTHVESQSALCPLNGKIYVLGGLRGGHKTDMVTCYNPETDQWTTRAHMNVRRWHPGVAVLDGMMYVLGDLRYSGCRELERYSEETDTWEIVGEMPRCHQHFRCVSFKLRTDASQR